MSKLAYEFGLTLSCHMPRLKAVKTQAFCLNKCASLLDWQFIKLWAGVDLVLFEITLHTSVCFHRYWSVWRSLFLAMVWANMGVYVWLTFAELATDSSQRRSKNFSRSSKDGDSSSRVPSIHLRRVSASISARIKCIMQQSLLFCFAAYRPLTISVLRPSPCAEKLICSGGRR